MKLPFLSRKLDPDPYGIEAALAERKAVRLAGGYVVKKVQG